MIIVPLTQGKVAWIDEEDAERVLVYRWHANEATPGVFYARSTNPALGPKGIYLHQFILDAERHGHVDHRDGNTLDCRRRNLRRGPPSVNIWNVHTPPRGRSGFAGVSFNRHGFPVAKIKANHRSFHLGSFETEELASQAYEAARVLRDEGRSEEIVCPSPLARKQNRPWSLR